jgi:hypothetical protein
LDLLLSVNWKFAKAKNTGDLTQLYSKGSLASSTGMESKLHTTFTVPMVDRNINIKHSFTQLYDMMDLSDGVMLLGESYGGKTKSIKILAASLQAVQGSSGKAPTCVILNPKAIKIDQLYGYFNDDEWKDGILATCFRNFAGFSENVSNYPNHLTPRVLKES